MDSTRKDPLRNFRFRLEILGISKGSFSEVTIGETTTEAVDYREGTDPPHARKLDGLTKYGNIVLKRGITDSTDLSDWAAAIIAGKIQSNRQTVTIYVMDETGADKARFVVADAWPVKYQPGALNGKGNEVIIETLELAHEGYTRQS
ncbi:phage tail-like protein [Paraburkholderia sp. BL27I4N3]|uniref:phage tail protein n=1 Tax=Paraburkholderia sp. BL27I4N3 TaxID=1938805 RepID=UPI000E2393DD|nr:phage tail protein [Paraburkholderia sp. BL27I4N3]REE18426.1 phage tail-like protein [Paraburkholderia sp. BL27I4N3]